MKTILITGSEGFVGKNLKARLLSRGDLALVTFSRADSPASLADKVAGVDVVFHLAGVNRPEDPKSFTEVNVGLTGQLVTCLARGERMPLVVFVSSTQADKDNPYGRSKKEAEKALLAFAERSRAPVRLFRLPNVFGKWSRPNYNSVVATFCHNIARELPITISDRDRMVELVYIDDVMTAFEELIDTAPPPVGVAFGDVGPRFSISLGDLAKRLYAFARSRETGVMPDLSDALSRALHATFVAAMDVHQLSYPLDLKRDGRGWLAELIKSEGSGQIFISKTHPGITRGDHYHHSKVEKFCVIQGDGVIRFRHILTEQIIAYEVSGRCIAVVDIPPGYTHNIENIGNDELIVLFWANRIFDPQQPDTFHDPV